MKVDHFILKKFKKKPEEFEKIKKEYELQANFNIEAFIIEHHLIKVAM